MRHLNTVDLIEKYQDYTPLKSTDQENYRSWIYFHWQCDEHSPTPGLTTKTGGKRFHEFLSGIAGVPFTLCGTSPCRADTVCCSSDLPSQPRSHIPVCSTPKSRFSLWCKRHAKFQKIVRWTDRKEIRVFMGNTDRCRFSVPCCSLKTRTWACVNLCLWSFDCKDILSFSSLKHYSKKVHRFRLNTSFWTKRPFDLMPGWKQQINKGYFNHHQMDKKVIC